LLFDRFGFFSLYKDLILFNDMNGVPRWIKIVLFWAIIAPLLFFILGDFISFVQKLSLDVYNIVAELEYYIFDYNPHPNELLVLQTLYAVLLIYCLFSISSNVLQSYPIPQERPLHSTILYK